MKKLLIFVLVGFMLSVPLVLSVVSWYPTEIYTESCKNADLNGDNVIDVGDLGILGANTGRKDCWVSNSWCNGADLNYDGKVDEQDNYILQGWYGKTCELPTEDCIKKPSEYFCKSSRYSKIKDYYKCKTGHGTARECEVGFCQYKFKTKYCWAGCDSASGECK